MDPNFLGTGPLNAQYFMKSGSFVWEKPYNCQFIYIIAAGAGGAGGGGQVAGIMCGGGGGGRGRLRIGVVPGIFAPHVFHIQIGVGGVGGSGDGADGSATGLFLSHCGNNFTSTTVLSDVAFIAVPGATGAKSGANGGGVGEPNTVCAFPTSTTPIIYMGIVSEFDMYYNSSALASRGTSETSANDVKAAMTSGGGGGGPGDTTTYGGGSIISTCVPLTLYGGNKVSAGSLPDIPSWSMSEIPLFCGGPGGGGSVGGPGQNGSPGGPGCGGGGGAGAGAGQTAGLGGNGGDGFVIIYTW